MSSEVSWTHDLPPISFYFYFFILAHFRWGKENVEAMALFRGYLWKTLKSYGKAMETLTLTGLFIRFPIVLKWVEPTKGLGYLI